MDQQGRKKLIQILQVLNEADRPLGGARIAQALELAGSPMSQRTIRYYLERSDRLGFTQPEGRRGRVITQTGRQELNTSSAVERVGFVASRVDALTYRMNFSLSRSRGEVVVNVSSLKAGMLAQAASLMERVFAAGLSMGGRLLIAGPGSQLGSWKVEPGHYGIATVCSVTMNGVLLSQGIPCTSRFGGLLQISNSKPVRFAQIIHYDGTTLDPLEIFIKSRMTSVRQASRTGSGLVGASFREIPAPSLDQARKLSIRMRKIGLGGVMLFGRPGQPLLEIPVAPGRVGLVVIGGLNPLAAVEEAGIPTQNKAMGTLMPFEDLLPHAKVLNPYLRGA